MISVHNSMYSTTSRIEWRCWHCKEARSAIQDSGYKKKVIFTGTSITTSCTQYLVSREISDTILTQLTHTLLNSFYQSRTRSIRLKYIDSGTRTSYCLTYCLFVIHIFSLWIVEMVPRNVVACFISFIYMFSKVLYLGN